MASKGEFCSPWGMGKGLDLECRQLRLIIKVLRELSIINY